MNNKDYAKEYVETRGLKPTSLYKINLILNHYSKYQKLSLQELLDEADQEEPRPPGDARSIGRR